MIITSNQYGHRPPDVSEPAVQVAGGAGEAVRNQAVEAVKAVHQELPLCVAFSEHKAVVGKDHIQHLLKLILRNKKEVRICLIMRFNYTAEKKQRIRKI